MVIFKQSYNKYLRQKFNNRKEFDVFNNKSLSRKIKLKTAIYQEIKLNKLTI